MKTLNSSVLIYSSKSTPIATQIKEYLEDIKICSEYTNNTQKATDYIIEQKPCLVIFDVPSDDTKAADFCKKIKKLKDEMFFNIYFLMDDNKNFEEQWTWFQYGVDEFGTRNTNILLICQRISCILTKYKRENVVIPQNGFVIDRERYMVFINNKEITLPRKEFELLMLLSSMPEKVFTREDIFRHVWGNRLVVGDRTIDVHIRKIREKVGEDRIATIKGVGYKFVKI